MKGNRKKLYNVVQVRESDLHHSFVKFVKQYPYYYRNIRTKKIDMVYFPMQPLPPKMALRVAKEIVKTLEDE